MKKRNNQVLVLDQLSLANVLRCLKPLQEVDDFAKYNLKSGDFDITNEDKELVDNIHTVIQMGKVYYRLILATLQYKCIL